MVQNRKNGKIDFLKFVFAVVIVLHHGAQKVLEFEKGYFIGGSLAVEFFFIVSGYLFMASISRMPEPTLPLGLETGKFMARKFKSFYPEIAVAFILGFSVEMLVQERTLSNMWIFTFQNAFLLNMTGIGILNSHGELWYISSMLLCMTILFPLLRKYPYMMTRVVLPLTALLIFGYFCGNKASPRDPLHWTGVTYKGNIRALAEISIGICLFPVVQKLRTLQFSTFGKILIFIIEWVCYICFVKYLYTGAASRRDYYYIAVCAVAIVLSFSQCGIDANWFQGRLFSFLGRISFPLYLSHNCWAKNINTFLPEDLSKKERLVVYLLVSAVSTLAVMFVSLLIRKLGKYLKEPAKKLLLKQEDLSVS